MNKKLIDEVPTISASNLDPDKDLILLHDGSNSQNITVNELVKEIDIQTRLSGRQLWNFLPTGPQQIITELTFDVKKVINNEIVDHQQNVQVSQSNKLILSEENKFILSVRLAGFEGSSPLHVIPSGARRVLAMMKSKNIVLETSFQDDPLILFESLGDNCNLFLLENVQDPEIRSLDTIYLDNNNVLPLATTRSHSKDTGGTTMIYSTHAARGPMEGGRANRPGIRNWGDWINSTEGKISRSMQLGPLFMENLYPNKDHNNMEPMDLTNIKVYVHPDTVPGEESSISSFRILAWSY